MLAARGAGLLEEQVILKALLARFRLPGAHVLLPCLPKADHAASYR